MRPGIAVVLKADSAAWHDLMNVTENDIDQETLNCNMDRSLLADARVIRSASVDTMQNHTYCKGSAN